MTADGCSNEQTAAARISVAHLIYVLIRFPAMLKRCDSALSPLIAGPILRATHTGGICLWLVSSRPIVMRLQLQDPESGQVIAHQLQHHTVQVGTRCFIHLLDVQARLPTDRLLTYNLLDAEGQSWLAPLPALLYPGQSLPVFMVQSTIRRLLHGSCRKPHYPGRDALLQADVQVEQSLSDPERRPALLMMSGDQIYADDVAGPMLVAIHQIITELGLFDEEWQGTEAGNLQALLQHPDCYYGRDRLLPAVEETVERLFFGGARKPVFTAIGAHNHLISLAEVIAMYLLVWSDTPWQWVDLQQGRSRIRAQWLERYDRECAEIEAFAEGLGRVRRLLAQTPVYMIFDDHDITDDWNLTRGWEEAAYGNPFSRRIIGNALIGYWLCQGWGNQPGLFQPLLEQVPVWFRQDGIHQHDQLVDALLAWQNWDYQLDTQPTLVVMDTRTHRWRSESSANKPSGLMDWETLCELQQKLIHQPAVILVSPAPIFGVKLIEVIQRLFTWIGKPLLVDAENWMAHPGSANVILNIFRHQHTPPQFIILSGDVHYSFAYDITLRFRRCSPQILQVTASGIKNEFPRTLLKWLDRINLMLYGSKSPLNFLTRRRDMKISRRQPDGRATRVLLNHCGIGDLQLADRIEDVQTIVHQSDGRTVVFEVE